MSRGISSSKAGQAARGPTKSAVPARRRRTREELTPETKERIFVAAAKVVGEHGYANASIKRITEAVGIAEGTFYLYFSSRQSLLNELLPHVGANMLKYVRDRIVGAKDVYDMEERGFRAFFEFLRENPGFSRVLNESEGAAPAAHREHFRLLGENYTRALRRGVAQGEIKKFDAAELETVAYILMAARNYLHMHYVKEQGVAGSVPESVVQAYMKFVRGGLR